MRRIMPVMKCSSAWRFTLRPSRIKGRFYAEPLTIENSWALPASAMSGESLQSLEKEFTVRYNQQDDTFTLSKQTLGPVLITNYDPDILCYVRSAGLASSH